MVFYKSELNKFILISIVIHLALAGVFLLNGRNDSQLSSEVSRSADTLSSRLRATFTTRSQPPQPKVIPAKKEINSAAVSSVAPTEVDSAQKVSEEATSEAPSGPTSEAVTLRKKYSDLVSQTIYKNKRYPRMAYSLNQEGLVVVKVRLDKTGKVLDAIVVEKAAYKILNEATIETINTIKKFPPIPSELGLGEITFIIPMEYKIKEI